MSAPEPQRGRLLDWWNSLDRVLLAAILVLMGTGLVLSLAASPTVAVRRGLPAFHFVVRQTGFTLVGAVLVLAVSTLDARAMRRLSLALFAAAVAGLIAVLLIGPEINGARRWLHLAGHSFQPSELAKPAFVVLSAWLLAEAERRRDVPALPLAIALLVLLATLLLLEPDFGQTVLVVVVWSAMFLVSGMSLAWGAAVAGLSAIAGGLAYWTLPHVRDRIGRFLNPAAGDNYQIERARLAIQEGGLFGRGPGEGKVKAVLPDAHTDFVFSVIAEEYGAVACLVLAGLFAFIAVRGLRGAAGAADGFRRNAIVGLTLMLALQAAINMAVNVGLIPAKGMTLPFISYGGSSILALSLAMGLLVAATRRPGSLTAATPASEASNASLPAMALQWRRS